jgi:acyl-CoA synthetase (AMP-forming)/AMP-acid ligase II
MALSVIQAGGVNIIIPKFDVDLTLKYIQEDKVTIFCDFPPILKSLLDRAEEVGYELSSLRIVGGLELPDTVKQLESKANATFWTGYGQTETSGPFCNAPYSQHPGSVGVPDILAEVEIIDDYGNILETGGSGEIVVRGPMVFKGYWNLEKDTEYTFRDGWHHTGDMGRFDEDGCLWYMGRTPQKDLIKSGGENVYPVEVERVILEHPLIEEAVVIGIPDVQWGEAIQAICVAKKGTSPTESQITEFVAQRIARFKKPKYVIFVPELPKTDSGFIDRQKVKEKYGESSK